MTGRQEAAAGVAAASVSESEVVAVVCWTWARLPESKFEVNVKPATSNTPPDTRPPGCSISAGEVAGGGPKVTIHLSFVPIYLSRTNKRLVKSNGWSDTKYLP